MNSIHQPDFHHAVKLIIIIYKVFSLFADPIGTQFPATLYTIFVHSECDNGALSIDEYRRKRNESSTGVTNGCYQESHLYTFYIRLKEANY